MVFNSLSTTNIWACSFLIRLLIAFSTISPEGFCKIKRIAGKTIFKVLGKAVKISRNTVKKYLRLIEVKALTVEHFLKVEDNELDFY